MTEQSINTPNRIKSSVTPNASIVVAGLGKQYVIGGAEQQYESFRELISGALLSPFRKFKRLSGEVTQENKFWALKNINFTVNRGEVIGVIGHNGAGKSTLLKLISRITPPTEGEVAIRGRVASLLEVGTGFHPELTGRENIYLNGLILGMRRAQIEKYFNDIVEFADIQKFIDTPVKRYSSGMYVRLAFSVAAHLDTDVLLVDEVLAVGDQKFQQKCLGKLGDVSASGRTVLFVSHNLSSVSKLCSKVLVLDSGEIVFDGPVNEGISHYNNQMSNRPVLAQDDYIGALHPAVSFDEIQINGMAFSEGTELDPFEDIQVTIEAHSDVDLTGFRTVFSIRRDGTLLFSIYDSEGLSSLSKGRFTSTFLIPRKLLLPGEHTCSIGGVTDNIDQWLWTRNYQFNIAHRWHADYDSTSRVAGLINLDSLGSRSCSSSVGNDSSANLEKT